MKEFIAINGVKLAFHHVIKDLTRPTIIFLHDSLGCIQLWRDFPSAVGEKTNCNTLIYDRQGYGESDDFDTIDRENNYMEVEADVLSEMIKTFELKDVVLFGHSDGGTIALQTAAKYPNLIKGVITEGAHVFVEDITIDGVKEGVLAYENTNLKERLYKYHGDKTDNVFWAWATIWLSDKYRDWNIEHELKSIVCSCLIIQGEQDEYGTIKQVDAIVNNISGDAVKLIIPAIGHTPHKEARSIVLKETANFINNLI